MAEPTYLVKIGGTDLTSYLKAPDGYKVVRNKLWTEAGRNLSGTLRATFIGIFPKIALTFRSLTTTEMKAVVALLDASSFTVNWWDANSQTAKEMTCYAGDFDPSIMHLDKERYEPFSVNLIPFSKMT